MGASLSSEGFDDSDSDYEEDDRPEHDCEEEEHDNDNDAKSSPKSRSKASVNRFYEDFMEEFEEATDGRVVSLTLGALDHSFLVTDKGIQVYRNFSRGIYGNGVSVKFDGSNLVGSSNSDQLAASKAILMRAETDMLLMSPMKKGRPHASSLHQLDLETAKIVHEWKFEKDRVDISMRDITNDTKGSQLDPSNSTFLGLADNMLCQWDMRDGKGVVQNSPVLHWNHGYLFSRGTNFQCFVTTGDGSIFVGSLDGRIRLYSKTSMWQSKTIFPGLGSPITHVDVTYDGRWVLGTTDTYLILICNLHTAKDGETEDGFMGIMPRLLKLSPQDSHLAAINNKFHGGHFSWVTENGIKERHLVATAALQKKSWNHEDALRQMDLVSRFTF
ncbi:protein CYPRO4-like isoform X2 [Prosopis cineraria]|uniref:protein CYPRO4-like isoform X2 n=1 Tax=Prosopis cineraria TaxID=364024 RepID=UPI00240FE204|nr:protein CYPRO4-like isoform X2 [Prosopis cineraria]